MAMEVKMLKKKWTFMLSEKNAYVPHENISILLFNDSESQFAPGPRDFIES